MRDQIKLNEELLRAAKKGNLLDTIMLLDSGADIHVKDFWNQMNALMLAAESGKVEVVELLLDRGADIEMINRHEMNALMLAAKNGHVEVVTLLLNRGDHDLNSALILASESGKAEVINLLLDRGADINVEDVWSGASPLKSATKAGNVDIVNLLLDRGANDLKSALELACASGKVEMARLLLDRGADNLKFALSNAAALGIIEVIELLLERGADINARDEFGDTALNYAIEHKKFDIVRLLLSRGADINAKNSQGISTLDFIQINLSDDYDFNFYIQKNPEFLSYIEDEKKMADKVSPYMTAFMGSVFRAGEALERGLAISPDDRSEDILAKFLKQIQSNTVIFNTKLRKSIETGQISASLAESLLTQLKNNKTLTPEAHETVTIALRSLGTGVAVSKSSPAVATEGVRGAGAGAGAGTGSSGIEVAGAGAKALTPEERRILAADAAERRIRLAAVATEAGAAASAAGVVMDPTARPGSPRSTPRSTKAEGQEWKR